MRYAAENRPYIRFGLGYNRMSIGRYTIETLGNKPYVQFLWHKTTRTLLISGLDEKVRDSFSIDYKDCNSVTGEWYECSFYRRAFLDAISSRMEWDSSQSYKVYGKHIAHLGVIAFQLNSAIIIGEEDTEVNEAE